MGRTHPAVVSPQSWSVVRRLLITLFLIHAYWERGYALDLTVTGSDGLPVAQYNWLIEEDRTYRVNPGVVDPQTLAVHFHSSYMPVVAAGDETSPPSNVALDPAKHYFVSVLPKNGYSLGGAPVAPGWTTATIFVNKEPLPAAQISVFVFEDNHPLNNAPDNPSEQGLAGFKVVLSEAGGRYGISGGQVMMDAFGNPIGTEYQAAVPGEDPTPISMGQGYVLTNADGYALLKNLSPAKYGVQVIPPAGQGWQQTSTLEGTKTIDAWVKPNEPSYFMEFGPPGPHVNIGFIRPTNDPTVLSGGRSITGQIVNQHMSRPPAGAFYAGAPFSHTTPWVALNEVVGGVGGRCVWAQPTDAQGNFTIPNVPPGNYQLSVFDSNLDLIYSFLSVTVPAGGGNVALGKVPVFQWFHNLHNYVFYDANENGFRDPGEPPMSDQNVNIRFRDGSMYQTAATDANGFVAFKEVFPFFSWLVAEVDFLRFKATGVTSVVDAGGPVNPADPWSFGGLLTPQQQPDPANPGSSLPYRVEQGPSLLQAFQGFIGQTNVLLWGKKEYAGDNGGISGIVYYATTRAEEDPALAAADPWEPGIPRVAVMLYGDNNDDGVIDDLDGDGQPTLADVDNYPFNNFPGGEDLDRGIAGQFDYGDALQIVHTDSWDDAPPSGALGEPFVSQGVTVDAFDGLRNFNQVRPGVFDGGYAFVSHFPGGMASGSQEVEGLPAGKYIVQAAPPPGYEIQKEEDINVVFGDTFTPGPLAGQLLPPPCVGDLHSVPDFLTLFPDRQMATTFKGGRPLCDRKKVFLNRGRNTAADFFMFTKVPVAGHIFGMVLDDAANEFDPNSPQFGEKYAPPWLPIAIRDWTGREISRVYSDQYGRYNALVPSTFAADRPMPSGFSPNMLTVSINDAGPIPDPANPGGFIIDPHFNRQYSQFSYTFMYMPGTTTYLDTPVLPVGAFVGAEQNPLDCESDTGTPKIHSVSGPTGGPWASAAGQRVTIISQGNVPVPNPAYDGLGGQYPPMITRDFGFGSTPGVVSIGGHALQNVTWSNGVIEGTIAPLTATGDLIVTRGDNNKSSTTGVTFTIGGAQPRAVPQGGSIQAAIDAAQPGELILVPPGTYSELAIMWKPVRLQGWGPGSTRIDARKIPAEKLQVWRDKVQALLAVGAIELLPGQNGGPAALEPAALFNEEGPGVMVLGRNIPAAAGGYGLVQARPNARVDGFTINGSDNAAGIMANAYAHYLEISNNRITGNQGVFGGGIRVGHPNLMEDTPAGPRYVSAQNDHIAIHHNEIISNSNLQGAGGGIALYTGSDNYKVRENLICGNISLGAGGGGIGHQGLSPNGLVSDNEIIFNESFNQAQTIPGGGLLISGAPALPGAGLTEGSGDVQVIGNLIHGNAAQAGDGGGVRLQFINGQDVQQAPDSRNLWYRVDLYNDIIANNVAGLAGGGISLQDAGNVSIAHVTVAHNDSTATAGEAFPAGSPNRSAMQPAGIVARGHTTAFEAAIGNSAAIAPYKRYSNPRLVNSIIWQNRSFAFVADQTVNPPVYGLIPDVENDEPAVFNDMAVVGTVAPAGLNPRSCLLTSTVGYNNTNISADPLFALDYFNGNRGSTVLQPEVTTAIAAPAAFDEGGNFIRTIFGPLILLGDYRLDAASPAIDAGSLALNGTAAPLNTDFDGQIRPRGTEVDIGADEYYPGNNIPPRARNDSAITNANTAVTINVLANDSDRDGTLSPSTVTVISSPIRRGRTRVLPDGRIIFTPRAGFTGRDRFYYVVRDSNGTWSNPGRVVVTVQ